MKIAYYKVMIVDRPVSLNAYEVNGVLAQVKFTLASNVW
jgi:hypothetical protein